MRRTRSPPPSSKTVEDAEIEKIIRKQEEVGLQLVTDGEFRRAWWHFDFFGMLDGGEGDEPTTASSSRASRPRRWRCTSTTRSGSPPHPMLEHFPFLKAHTKVTPKMTIPSPSVMHFRRPRPSAQAAYPDRDCHLR